MGNAQYMAAVIIIIGSALVHYFQYKPHKKTGISGDLFDQSNYILSSSISYNIWL